jgi:hypothetical protein
MDAEEVGKIDLQARRRFTYLSETGDTWRSHADDALVGKAWHADCDDLASTVLDLLGRAGVNLQDRYRLVVASKGKKPDHMVACVRLGDGCFRIVGDTFGPDYPAAVMKHRGVFYNRLSENSPEPIWRKGVPWTIKNGTKHVRVDSVGEDR